MTPEFIIEFAKEAIMMTLMISMPMLMLGLIVGLIVSVFQAVTSIQEMTLSFVPKIIAVFAGLLFFAPWMLETFTEYTRRIIENIPLYIK
ncbi:MAG: flagellar biosynthesis protein FliQ [Desulfamplus sp.]|nr:flagellar biosynthesis protein FliQ [Desulfamplus sp.]MBF0211107.1 flagellar biosynthesis protein FliQ [Desulfamplus sp.]MBF0241550.1 flagellar biosynthesis protein FliQ [Desulfamplus sp.]MBF0389580.1 flagellar biosynthesis protein FliQ [Desulfamplus sp.]